uniref:Putative ubiquitin-protein ligase 1 n=1 Tax=Ixodes ricinus TaxID=34613 RepID=V5H8J5_IXORI
MKAKSSVISAFLLVLLAECGVGSSEVSENCGEITMFNVSTIMNGSDVVCLTTTRWTGGDTSHNFSYLGNWTGHDKCLSNCNPCHPDPCTCRPGCICLPMEDYPTVGRCVYNGTSLPKGVTNSVNLSMIDCAEKEEYSDGYEDEDDGDDGDENDGGDEEDEEDDEDEEDEEEGEDEEDEEDDDYEKVAED